MAILAFMLTGIIVAFERTVDSASRQSLREQAVAVAQRHMELLLANPQEPNSTGLPEIDEIAPFFTWQLNLERVAASTSAARRDLTNTAIVATVRVDCALPEAQPFEPVELIRYFATLRPKPGQTVAVPLTSDKQEALWYIELKEKLGREPTLRETLQQLLKVEDIPPELLEEIDLTDPNDIEDDEDLEFEE